MDDFSATCLLVIFAILWLGPWRKHFRFSVHFHYLHFPRFCGVSRLPHASFYSAFYSWRALLSHNPVYFRPATLTSPASHLALGVLFSWVFFINGIGMEAHGHGHGHGITGMGALEIHLGLLQLRPTLGLDDMGALGACFQHAFLSATFCFSA